MTTDKLLQQMRTDAEYIERRDAKRRAASNTTTANEIIQDGKVRTLAQRDNGETYIESERRLTAEERTAAASNPPAAKLNSGCPECGALALQPCAHPKPANNTTAGPSEHSDRGEATARLFQIGGYFPTERTDGLRIATINIPNPNGGGQDVAEVLEPYAEKFVQAVNSFDAMRDALRKIQAWAVTGDGYTLKDIHTLASAALADAQQ